MKPSRDILVIDDEPVVLRGVARICGSEGLAVDTAASAAEGLTQLERADYRLVICDIMMCGMDGFEFLAETARRGGAPPIVMTTGNSTVQNAVRSLRCGAIDYVAKPFTADELMAVVRRGLNYPAATAPAASLAAAATAAGRYRLGRVSWAQLEPVGTALVGADACFVSALAGIRGIELFSGGNEVVQGASCATVLAADGLPHDLMGPITGEIIEANAAVVADPALVANDPFGAGWLYRVLPSDPDFNLSLLTPPVKAAAPLP